MSSNKDNGKWCTRKTIKVNHFIPTPNGYKTLCGVTDNVESPWITDFSNVHNLVKSLTTNQCCKRCLAILKKLNPNHPSLQIISNRNHRHAKNSNSKTIKVIDQPNNIMLHEEVAQLKRSLLREIAAHDKTIRTLEAERREIERMRENFYKNRIKTKCESK